MKSHQKRGFHLTGFLGALFALVVLAGCTKELDYSQKRAVAEQFMTALAQGDQQAAYEVSQKTPENKLAVKLMAEAIALKKQNENITEVDYVYLNENSTGENEAKVTFSQLLDGKPVADNLIVVMRYDPAQSHWRVHNLLLR
ncbi:MAG: hypothetical protein R3194_05965 [Limnobacter sp.]|nr:hypothetical protein [Limnobacter sp.]